MRLTVVATQGAEVLFLKPKCPVRVAFVGRRLTVRQTDGNKFFGKIVCGVGHLKDLAAVAKM